MADPAQTLTVSYSCPIQQRIYRTRATWDPAARVWVSSSDIPGLVVEAATVAEFVQLVRKLAPDLLAENDGVVH